MANTQETPKVDPLSTLPFKKNADGSVVFDKDHPPTVTRNGQSVVLGPSLYGKRSDNFGKAFWRPVLNVPSQRTVTIDGTEQVVLTDVGGLLWAGITDVIDTLNSDYRVIFADLQVDATDEKTGELDVDALVASWQDFTAGVAKLQAIIDQLEELNDAQQALVTDEHFGELDDNSVPTAAAMAIKEQLEANSKKIKPLKAKKAEIEARYAKAAEKRKAKKEAKEAAAKAAAGTGVPVLQPA